MKNYLPKTLAFTCLLLLCLQLSANTIIIRGHIKDSDGINKAWWPVSISIDSTLTTNCISHHTVYTDSTGYYYDTLTCNSKIKQVYITTYDCNYTQLFHSEKTGNNNTIESNFIICSPPPSCNANFYITKDSVNPKRVYVAAHNNTSGNDSVIQRIWYWGDGDSTKTKSTFASHTYKKDGLYILCMNIKTAKGCSNFSCDSIEIYSKCRASFTYSSLPDSTNGYGLKLYSNQSSALPGDSIVKRIWLWGDGTQNTYKDSINASHYYSRAGTYNVTLIIKTKNGCTDTARVNINVPVGGFQCQATFSFTADSSYINFDSHESKAGLYDSIITRKWSFGDSTYLYGNIISPSHTYADTGWYYTCLSIKTAKGCESTICKMLSVTTMPGTHCKAAFLYDTSLNVVSNSIIQFNSIGSKSANNDSIIKRSWYFGDGTSKEGNEITTSHEYNKGGIYNACLFIQTRNGCFDSTCNNIIIPPIQNKCSAVFNYKNQNDSVFFNSSGSSTGINDRIVMRSWNFGDSTYAQGPNLISPTHRYKYPGTYNVCFTIKTTKGCTQKVCNQIIIKDSIVDNGEWIKILSLVPNPVSSKFKIILWSKVNNMKCELSIFDAYGLKKWGESITLIQGNNIIDVSAGSLPMGTYYLKASTLYGAKSKLFFKL